MCYANSPQRKLAGEEEEGEGEEEEEEEEEDEEVEAPVEKPSGVWPMVAATTPRLWPPITPHSHDPRFIPTGHHKQRSFSLSIGHSHPVS